MLVTVNSFAKCMMSQNGVAIPVVGDNRSSEDITAAGNTTALPAGVIGVEIATDTAITINAYGAGTNRYMPANSVAWFPAVEGQVFAIATA